MEGLISSLSSSSKCTFYVWSRTGWFNIFGNETSDAGKSSSSSSGVSGGSFEHLPCQGSATVPLLVVSVGTISFATLDELEESPVFPLPVDPGPPI